MSNIEFEADNMNLNRPTQGGSFGGSQNKTNGTKGMISWLIGHGIVRSENMGQTFLLSFAGVNFILSYIILKYFGVL